MRNKNIISIQNSLSVIGGGAIAQKSILDSYFQEGTITNIEIFKFIKPSKLNKYFFNLKLFLEIRKLIVEKKPDQIIIGQFHSQLTIFLILILTNKIPKTHIVHTAEIFCLNSLMTNNKDLSICPGIKNSGCVRNGCHKHKKHIGYLRLLISRVRNYFLRRYINKFVVISDFMKSKLINNGFENVEIIKIDLGVPTHKYTSSPQHNSKIIKILYVGVLEWHKGVKEMILGFKHYSNIKSEHDCILQIIGSGSMKEELELLVEKENLEERIKFIGSVSHNQINDFYANSDVFLFCSFFETFGLVILEAMKNQMYIIFNNRGALPEVLNNYKTKIMLENVRPETISKAILDYVKNEK